MKKLISLALAVLVFVCAFVSCDEYSITSEQFSQSSETVYDKTTGEKSILTGDTLDYGNWSPDLAHPNFIPWTSTNVANLAKADGSLRFYFMAGEGTEVAGVGEKIGDCCLVVFPNGQTMLIDACSNAQSSTSDAMKNYKLTLVNNLSRLGISKLDYVVITHQHSDHYGCFTASGGIADNFQVGHLYYNGLTGHSGYSTIKNKCDAKDIAMTVLQEGDTLTVGDVSILCVNPTKGATTSQYANGTEGINNASVTLKFTYGNVSALFTGDLYQSGMTALVNRYKGTTTLDVDILKIPHHGHSETSISDSFASATSPKIAIASSGIALNDNVYKCYKKVGADVIGDYNEGYVILAVKDNKIYTKTSRVIATDYYKVYDDLYKGV